MFNNGSCFQGNQRTENENLSSVNNVYRFHNKSIFYEVTTN